MVDLNLNFALRDQGVSNSLASSELPRHRWYFVKEGFSPDLVNQAVAQYEFGPGDLLLDPFAGSGTVPVTGALGGLTTIAFELNPFLRFLAAAKLQSPDVDRLQSASETIEKALASPKKSPLEGISTFTEGNRWERWLFPLRVLRSYEGGRRAVSQVSVDCQDLLRLALIGATMDCCNAARDGKCLRYKNDWQNREANSRRLIESFRERIDVLVADIRGAPLLKPQATIVEGDARELLSTHASHRFRLCVTSPPYLNSFDYSDIYRPELFLGGFVDSNRSLMQIRLKTVRSHVQANWSAPTNDEFGLCYQRCITELRAVGLPLWDRRLPTMVQAYFEDMEKVLRALKKNALKGASLWLVVSTSAYAGIEVPVDLILAEIGQRAGWHLREVGVLRYLRSSGQHMKRFDPADRKAIPLRESVVVFDATKPRSRRLFAKL
jgi:hypothetical protein